MKVSKRKLDKTDIGEMLHWASSAFHSGFLKVEIDSDHAMELCERALDNDRLNEENAKLREVLEFVIENSEPHSFVDFSEAQQLLNQLKERGSD